MHIVLSNGKKTLVDEDFYPWLNRWRWHESQTGYVIRRIGNPGKIIWLHRLVNDTPKGADTDHINRDRLDNRKENLRTATRSENILNSKLRNDNTSGYKGVYWEKSMSTWRASIYKDNKNILIGRFKDKENAIMARQSAEFQL